MMPTFVTSRPPTIPSSVASDNTFSRVLKAGRLETDALTVGPNMSGTFTLGAAGVTTRTPVAGTGAFTYTGIKTEDLVQVSLKDVNGSVSIGAGYSLYFVAAAGTVPAHFEVTSIITSAPTTPVAADVSTLQYFVFKTFA
jgi:hypothetical protein